jgi:hypothetical protein
MINFDHILKHNGLSTFWLSTMDVLDSDIFYIIVLLT